MKNKLESKLEIDYELIFKYLNKLNKNSEENIIDDTFIDEVCIFCCDLLPHEFNICTMYKKVVLEYIKRVDLYGKFGYEKDIFKLYKLLGFLFNSLKKVDEYIKLYDSEDAIDNNFLYKELGILLGLAGIQEEIYEYLKKLETVVRCDNDSIKVDGGYELKIDEEFLANVKGDVSNMEKEISAIKKYIVVSFFKSIKSGMVRKK